jgi:predicted ABC-type ATPase
MRASMYEAMPSLYIIAGPNGAGKTTFIKRFAPRHLALLDFVNADEIARGLSPLAPERAQIEAGRIMLERIRQFISRGKSFAMETKLSGRTYRLVLKQAKEAGYATHLDFLALPSVEDSIRRVANRVQQGGHNVPEADLRRRFRLGLSNLFDLYRPYCDTRNLYLNSDDATLIAHGTAESLNVNHQELFETIVRDFNLNL